MPNKYLHSEFEKLVNIVSQLNKYKSEARKVYIAQDEAIRKFHEGLPDWSTRKEDGMVYYFHYQSPSTGKDLLAEPVPLMLDDQLELNSLQQLKTYHWLLVEAYEAFEDFLENAYAFCGVKGISIWEQPNKWAHEGSSELKHYKTKRKPYGQLEAFRDASEHFARFEVNGPTKRNFKIVFVMMERLRHVIVHSGGYCDDFKAMIDNMQGPLKGMDMKVVREYADLHFMMHRGRRLVDLFEVQNEDQAGLKTGYYQDVLLGFLRMVVEYAHLILESIELHQSLERI